MWDFLQSVEGSDVVQSVDWRAEASMEAKYLTVDERCQRKVVEQVLRRKKLGVYDTI